MSELQIGKIRAPPFSACVMIVRPALLIALNEVERQVHKGFRTLEKEIERL